MSTVEVLGFVGAAWMQGQVEEVLVPGVGPFGIEEEEMPFPFLLTIAEEGEGIDAGLVNGVVEAQAIECGYWII